MEIRREPRSFTWSVVAEIAGNYTFWPLLISREIIAEQSFFIFPRVLVKQFRIWLRGILYGLNLEQLPKGLRFLQLRSVTINFANGEANNEWRFIVGE